MSIDWQRLLQLREQQQTLAERGVARDRSAASASQAQLDAAQGQHAARVQLKRAHWQAMVQAPPDARLGVAQLRHAGRWSVALDAQIAQAQATAQQAGQDHAQRAAALDDSRRQLRAAHGDLEKARRVSQTVQREGRERTERRLDEAADEAASQAWVRRA